jgi:hypothetical protein
MPIGTPFHSRTAPLCASQNWRTWSGYFVASSYDVMHDYEYHAIRNSAGLIGKRESASRPHHGIVTVRTTGTKADGTVFMTFERSALIPMRGHAVDDKLSQY